MEQGEGLGPGGVDDAVLGLLSSIKSSITALSQSISQSRSDAACREGVVQGFEALQSLQAAWLGLVADLDGRRDAVPGARSGQVATTFLRSRLLRTAGQAASDVRAAHAMKSGRTPAVGGLPALARAFAAGQVSRDHVDVAVRTVRKLPKGLLSEQVPPFDPLYGEDDLDSSPPDGTPESGSDAGDVNVSGGQASATAGLTAGEIVDAFFAAQSQQVDSARTAQLAKHLLEALDPDAQDGFDPRAVQRRALNHSTDAGGMITGRFQLDAVTGAWFVQAIEYFSAPDPAVSEQAADGTTVRVRDPRSAAQRRADALATISRLALGSEQAGTGRAGEPPRIVIHTGLQDILDLLNAGRRPPTDSDASGSGLSEPTDSGPSATEPSATEPSDCEPCDSEPTSDAEPCDSGPRVTGSSDSGPRGGWGLRGGSGEPGSRKADCEPLGAIGPRLLGRFSCDAVLQKALFSRKGAVLDLGRDSRTVSRGQRRALNARDRGCVVPGCGAPPRWCEAHHVVYWRHGGRTDIDQLALVCGQHHTLIHLGVWELVMIDGVAWSRPPSWVDPARHLIRNTQPERIDWARELGDQLRLALYPDPGRLDAGEQDQNPHPYRIVRSPMGRRVRSTFADTG